MKKIFLTAAFAVVVASPALAASSHHLRSNAPMDSAYAEGSYAYVQPDAYTVVDEGKVLGRDPDLFIRQSLLRSGDTTEVGGN